jgi:hypothetical protein
VNEAILLGDAYSAGPFGAELARLLGEQGADGLPAPATVAGFATPAGVGRMLLRLGILGPQIGAGPATIPPVGPVVPDQAAGAGAWSGAGGAVVIPAAGPAGPAGPDPHQAPGSWVWGAGGGSGSGAALGEPPRITVQPPDLPWATAALVLVQLGAADYGADPPTWRGLVQRLASWIEAAAPQARLVWLSAPPLADPAGQKGTQWQIATLDQALGERWQLASGWDTALDLPHTADGEGYAPGDAATWARRVWAGLQPLKVAGLSGLGWGLVAGGALLVGGLLYARRRKAA